MFCVLVSVHIGVSGRWTKTRPVNHPIGQQGNKGQIPEQKLPKQISDKLANSHFMKIEMFQDSQEASQWLSKSQIM